MSNKRKKRKQLKREAKCWGQRESDLCDLLYKVRESNAMLHERIAELKAELEAERVDMLSATITIEHIRDALFELLTGRIADWLNSQGDTFTCSTIPKPGEPARGWIIDDDGNLSINR